MDKLHKSEGDINISARREQWRIVSVGSRLHV